MKSNKLQAGALLFAFILLSIFIYSFINPESENNQTSASLPSTGTPSNGFLVGAICSYNQNITAYDTGGFNITHIYTSTVTGHYTGDPSRHTPCGNVIQNDYLDYPASYGLLQTAAENMYARNNSRFFWQRPRIEWLCYGQSSIYKAVQSNSDLWFYSFNTALGLSELENGSYVKHCSDSILGPGARVVLSRLKSNTEQCRVGYDGSTNQWMADNECDWFVKPRIRIDSNFAHTNPESNVCIIYVKSQSGNDTITPVTIKAKHFLDGNQQYNGRYLEEFYFNINQPPSAITFHGALGTNSDKCARGTCDTDPWNVNHADIQVYWYDNCQMWIDYVKVENDVADKLLSGYYDDPAHPENQWIKNEVDAIKNNVPGANVPPVYAYYIELFEFNNIPCMAYVNHKIDSLSGGRIGLMADLLCQYDNQLPWHQRDTLYSPQILKRTFCDKGFPQIFIGDPYPITADYSSNCAFSAQYNEIPSTFKVTWNNNDLFKFAPPATYDTWLQGTMDTVCVAYETDVDSWPSPHTHGNDLVGDFQFLMKRGNALTNLTGKPFIAMLQDHQWMSPRVNGADGEVDREPTNEEENMMTNVAISYGAKGIIYWGWASWGSPDTCNYTNGLMADKDGTISRKQNRYGEAKWDTMKSIINRLKGWGSTVMRFDTAKSYIYRLQNERNALISNSCFSFIMTWRPGAAYPPCTNDNPDAGSPTSMIYDCQDQTYLQVATFSTGGPTNQYFMLVNKRCSPYLDAYSDEDNGGRRYVKAQFKPSSHDLAGSTNWSIKDIGSGRVVATFNKNSYDFVGIDTLQPGEGKIYELIPTIVNGGILVADEVIEDANFTCEDTVWNNGYNITFKGHSNIVSFSDSGTIVMTGGTFQNDSASDGAQTSKNTFQGANGHKWNGLQFNGTNVKIYNSKFQDINSPVGGNYAVNCINCPLNDIRYNTFISSSDTAGGVNITYANMSSLTGCNTYIMSNTFTMNNSYSRAIQLQNYAGVTLGAYIENNSFSSNGYATGIFTSTLTSGVIKNNTLSGFVIGINSLLTSCDLYGNTITNTGGVGTGITANDLSVINMAPTSSGVWTGGMNSITNAGGNSVNLAFDNSAYYLYSGYNIFNVDTSGSSAAKNLDGSFWNGSYKNYTKVKDDCFKLSGNVIAVPDIPHVNITDYYDNSVSISFPSYNCSGTPPTNYDLVNIGNGLYDTIRDVNGQGGGYSSVITANMTYDSICVQMRHRNYSVVKNLCYELINAYPDSEFSIASLQTLYLASIASDTSQSSYNNLKTYYENLILNHGSNGALVKISNYFDQKCKVLLRQYASALSGFQEIINNNQYNYQGLLARWDYMATSLLMNGGGGGENSIDNDGLGITNDDQIDKYDELEGDKTPFTQEQRGAIRKSVSNTLNDSRTTDEQKVNTLIEKEKNGDAVAQNQLRQKMALKNTIKTVKPKNIFEHIKIVNGDIQRIFGDKNPLKNSPKNNIPTVFKLYQSYPNPFNPTATIKYDLPKDVKVTIKIYDILGRMVKKLVDEFKQAGSYSVQFNGTNLASGVYFYRIEAGENVVAKKMVLVK